jgi:uncharacterized membrane protein YgaE (UPF0421/DUF939 family)
MYLPMITDTRGTARQPAASLRAYVQRPYVRLAVLSAAAASVAFALGTGLHHVSPVVAAITALISVRPTFHASMQEALRQVLGVLIGAGVAFVAMMVAGYSSLALFVAIVACFVLAWALKLGEGGAMSVGVTVILVVGPFFNTDAIETRLLGAALGSLVALAFSFFTRPGSPHDRALAAVVAQADTTATLLAEIADTLARAQGHVERDTARGWHRTAEQVVESTMAIRAEAEDALDGSRWSPMIRHDEAAAVLEQVLITEDTALTVLSMCDDLLDASDRTDPLPPVLAASLSDVLRATAGAISQQSQSALERPAEPLDDDTGTVLTAYATRRDATAAVRTMDDTMPLLLGGSLVRDSEKITDALSGR